jgi:carbonic anhydrase
VGADAFEDVLAANEEYARGFALEGLTGRAGKGLAVLTCIDSRIEPLTMLGLEPGDAKIIRNAGARVDAGVLATLALAHRLLGVTRAMVVAHTDCRMSVDSEAELHEAMAAAGGPDTGDLSFAVAAGRDETVRRDVDEIRSSPHLAGVEVAGFVYDVETGLLRRVC